MSDFVAAIGLVFLFEGIMFAAFPRATRRAMEVASQTGEQPLRLIGLASAVVGILIVWAIRG